MSQLHRHAGLVALVGAVGMVGCAARPAAPEAVQAPAADPATTEPGGAEAVDGDAAAGDATSTPGGGSATRDEEAPRASSTLEREAFSSLAEALDAFEEEEIRLGELLGGGKATALDARGCASICEALASMKRASDAICDLAGEDDRRCTESRDKLTGNEERIAGRGCRCSD